MVADVTVDEYYERYRQQTHEELFRLLMAGLPAQVDTIADTWHTVEAILGTLATALHDDFARVVPTWTGTGSREFQYRLGLITAFAQKLAEEAAAIRSGLTVMSGSLTDAQRRAESDRPEASQTQSDAMAVALGHTMSADERAKARERVSMVVAHLAAEYAVTEHRSWPATIPVEPDGLPTGGIVDVGAMRETVEAIVVPTTAESAEATALAGAGTFGVAPDVGGLPGMSASSSPAPPSTLSGAGPMLAGVGGHLISRATGGEGRAGGGTAGTGAGTAGAPLMAAGAGGGAGVVGRSADGYAITDPRLASDGNAWSVDGKLEWDGEADAPPSILGHGDVA